VKLSADAVPARVGLPAGVAFKSTATPDAQAALKGVNDFLNVRHHGLPAGQKVEITLVGDAAPADLASSTFAAAVAVDSMLAGWTPDPGLAVIGAVQNNGDLVPVTNPIPRLLAAMRGGAERVLLPEKMFKQVTDVLVSEGPVAFAKIQIFTISNFDDAAAIASASPEASIVRAIRRFAEVERMLVAGGPDADATLREPACKEALREVLTTAPSHMSARLLLGRTTGQYTTLSIEGSLTALESMCTTMLKDSSVAEPHGSDTTPNATVQAEASRLGSARTRMDATVQPIVDALLAYADVVKAWTERPPANALTARRTLPLPLRRGEANPWCDGQGQNPRHSSRGNCDAGERNRYGCTALTRRNCLVVELIGSAARQWRVATPLASRVSPT
jgi:hypothetical protein